MEAGEEEQMQEVMRSRYVICVRERYGGLKQQLSPSRAWIHASAQEHSISFGK